jgi:uncharacterized protein YcfL
MEQVGCSVVMLHCAAVYRRITLTNSAPAVTLTNSAPAVTLTNSPPAVTLTNSAPAVTLTNSAPSAHTLYRFYWLLSNKSIFPFNNITTDLAMKVKNGFCADGMEFT